ncbi:MAG: hypothetical protein PW788_10365 [Micavibrio sp.]|nr:hypothetical protein [Micavibrio sp.]
MWYLYIVMSMLAAGVCIKLLMPLLAHGRHKHNDDITEADRRLLYGITCFVPLAALAVYLLTGRPDLPGSPAIFGNLDSLMDRQKSLLMRHPYQVLVEENPDDLGALVQLAQITSTLGNYKDSIKFYQRSVIVARETNDPLLRIYATQLGETQVLATGGTVGDDAIGTFEYVLTLQHDNPFGIYYLALAKQQHGDLDGAIRDWEGLLSDGPSAAYWKAMVRDALAKAQAEAQKKKKD